MATSAIPLHLPQYQVFIDGIATLGLPMSGSELHGVMCGYLCAGAVREGENYLRALTTNKNEPANRIATLALFGLFAVSQQQIANVDFEFQLMVPDDEQPLLLRAQAFREWCDGFTQGIHLAGVYTDQLHEDEAREAMEHLIEFAQLDYGGLELDEDDERALMEVSEYTRMAVLHIFTDLQAAKPESGHSGKAH